MENFNNLLVSLVTYEDIYQRTLKPKLEAIDIMLKSDSNTYSLNKVCALIDVKPFEIEDAMFKLNIKEINKINFFQLIFYFSTPICNVIKKGWLYHSKSLYTPEIIADIYNLNLEKVIRAFDDLDLDYASEENLHDIFKRIHITLFASSLA